MLFTTYSGVVRQLIAAFYVPLARVHISPFSLHCWNTYVFAIGIVWPDMTNSVFVDIVCMYDVNTFQAWRAGHTFPRYVWITYAGDFQRHVVAAEVECTASQLSQFLEGVLLFLPSAGNGEVSLNLTLEVYMHIYAHNS